MCQRLSAMSLTGHTLILTCVAKPDIASLSDRVRSLFRVAARDIYATNQTAERLQKDPRWRLAQLPPRLLYFRDLSATEMQQWPLLGGFMTSEECHGRLVVGIEGSDCFGGNGWNGAILETQY